MHTGIMLDFERIGIRYHNSHWPFLIFIAIEWRRGDLNFWTWKEDSPASVMCVKNFKKLSPAEKDLLRKVICSLRGDRTDLPASDELDRYLASQEIVIGQRQGDARF